MMISMLSDKYFMFANMLIFVFQINDTFHIIMDIYSNIHRNIV